MFESSAHVLVKDSLINTVNDLLICDDELFIRASYRTILGREPDGEGLKYYLNQCKNGGSKMEILGQLATSPEGKQRGTELPGLDDVVFRYMKNKTSLCHRLFAFVGIHQSKNSKVSESNESNTLDQSLIEQLNSSVASKDATDVLVTVVIPTKNPGQIFREVLIAVLQQKTPWPFEVIVVDSGSTDGTVEFIKKFSRVHLRQIEPAEFGHGKTRNLGVSLSRGMYVAMLTHDAKPCNNRWLLNLVSPLISNQKVAGVFGRHLAYPDASPCTSRELDCHFDHFLQWPSVMGMDDPWRYEKDQGYRQVLHYFSDNNACLRKSVWEQIPYPDVDFAEDQLWAKQIIEAGFMRAFANDAAVYHSHDYSVMDTLRRSFDESRALRKLFGYDLCSSIWHGICCAYACWRRDIAYLKTRQTGLAYASSLLRIPFLNIAKQAGYYLGRYQTTEDHILFNILSLDNKKKRQPGYRLPVSPTQLQVEDASAEQRNNQSTEGKREAIEKSLKIDIPSFYNFVLTPNARHLSLVKSAPLGKTINWFIPDFGIGSGGHLNIFRFIYELESRGYTSTICIVGNHRHQTPELAHAEIVRHFYPIKAGIVLSPDHLPQSTFSFATNWMTAYAVKGFPNTLHKLYFVQDFEPAFYAHGSEYSFAEETYKFGFTGVCAGDWLASLLANKYGMQTHSFSFSYDKQLYKQTPRREPETPRVFCYCRPPTLRRGVETAMLALNIVGQRLPQVEFIFAGWDMGHYHFPHTHLNAGTVPLCELPDLYSQCDVGLVLSFTNLSLLPLEMMACGCVVVSNRGPNTEWLLTKENCILSDENPVALANSIVMAFEMNAMRKRLIKSAKEFALGTDWGSEVDKVLSLLERMRTNSPGHKKIPTKKKRRRELSFVARRGKR